MITSWKEQKAYERQLRVEWLQSLSDAYANAHAAAIAVGMMPSNMRAQGKRYGVTFDKKEYGK